MTNITCVNSVTTVQQGANLSKNYFNIKGKFHTKDTTFYIYLDSDVYEIPLAELQVSGVNPASMQAGIDALAALLANAGASGGGAVVADNLTIQGNGTIASPLTSSLKYHANEPNINEPGVYFYDGAFSGSIAFNEIAGSYGDQVYYIINYGQAIPMSGGYPPQYEGVTGSIAYVQSYSTLTIYWNSFEAQNTIVNPNFSLDLGVIDLDTYGNNYGIQAANNTLYRFTNNSTGYEIILPDPVNFEGKQINIINNYNGALGYNSGGSRPLNSSGSTVTSINNNTSHTLISDGTDWRILNIQS